MPSLPFSLPSFFCSICLPEINTFCLSCSLFQCSSAESKFSPKISLFHNNFRRKLFITYSVQSFQLFSICDWHLSLYNLLYPYLSRSHFLFPSNDRIRLHELMDISEFFSSGPTRQWAVQKPVFDSLDRRGASVLGGCVLELRSVRLSFASWAS